MRFFELHFNPSSSLPTQGPRGFLKTKTTETPDVIFDTFCYEPENVYEKRLGYLLVAGELKNVLPANLKLLDNIASNIKQHYYASPMKSSPETAIKEALKKTNDFLRDLTKKGQVSWLGNLNLGVSSLIPQKREKFMVNFAKVGTVKILLLRPGQILDIGKNLAFSEIEPYPLKIFGNIVSGKLDRNDVVCCLTKDVYEYFAGEGILKEMAKAAQNNFLLGVKEILKKRKKELDKISGLCLLSVLTQEFATDKKPSESIIFKKEKEQFSLKRPLLAFFKNAFKIKPAFLRTSPKNLLGALKFDSLHLNGLSSFFRALSPRKNLILIMLLLLLLLLGFLLF